MSGLPHIPLDLMLYVPSPAPPRRRALRARDEAEALIDRMAFWLGVATVWLLWPVSAKLMRFADRLEKLCSEMEQELELEALQLKQTAQAWSGAHYELP